MATDVLVNSFGILLNIIGVIMVFYFSPINEHTIDGGNLDEGYVNPVPIANRRNKLLKLGVLVVVVGSILQLASNFI